LPDQSDQTFFPGVLVNDVLVAIKRLHEVDDPTHRRELVRTISASIEGLHWQLKNDLLENCRDKLSILEQAAMQEETFFVDGHGEVHSQPRYLPLTDAIRLVIEVVKRVRPTYEIDLTHPGWACLKQTIKLRNRLVHPKKLEELAVTDAERNAAVRGFRWFLARAIEVLRQQNEYLTAEIEELEAELRQLEQGWRA
jgi:hypothetical protein